MSEFAEPAGAESLDTAARVEGQAAEAHVDDAPARSLSPLLWPTYLLFRPAEFFRRVAPSAPEVVIVLAVYCAGIVAIADRISTASLRQGASGAVTLGVTKTWEAYWVTLLVGALFTAPLQYLIVGWWHRCRIIWSGAKNPDGFLTRRVLYLSKQLFVLPLIAIIFVEMVNFDTPLEAEQADDVSLLYVGALVFLFWACVANYRGVRALFDVGPKRAIVWFLVLPFLVYGVSVGAVVALSLLTDLESASAQTDRPQRFASELVEFQYPGNWFLESDAEGFDPVRYIPIFADGVYFEVMLYDSYVAPADELSYSVEAVREEFGEATVISQFDSWGPLQGEGTVVHAPFTDDTLIARIFVTRLAGDIMLELQERTLATLDSQNAEGFALIQRTFELRVTLPEEDDAEESDDATPEY